MNKTLFFIFVTGLFLVSFSCQKQHQKKQPTSLGFSGVWNDSININFKNCYAVFSEVGNRIYVAHYIEFKGQPFFEYGKGIIKGDSIIYNVDVIRPIPAWGSDSGTHYLKLSKDKNTLKGIFITSGGNKGPLVFKRR